MRYLDYYATLDESLALVQTLCDQGFKAIAQPQLFDRPEAPTFDKVDERLREIVKIQPDLFLAGIYSRFPPQFLQVKDGPNGGKYFLYGKGQGPLINLFLARINPVDGVRRILAGQTSHQTAYEHPETGEMEPPSPELKAAFKQVVVAIRKLCVKHSHEGREILIAPQALVKLQSGEAKLQEN